MKKRLLSILLTICMLATMISNVSMTSFGATDVTRGEWITSLVETFSMAVDDDAVLPDNYFGDINSDMECYDDILLAVEFGVIDLAAGEDFRPDEPASREFAAHTLNYCLNFQLEEDAEYTYSEADSVTYTDDIQVAVNRGWFALSGGDFLPEQNITQEESTAMLADAAAILEGDVINEDYDSKFDFADGVVVIPQGTDISISEDYTVTVTDYESNVKVGDVFVVFTGEIPVALVATAVSVDGAVTTITSTPEGAENAIISVDSEGVTEIDLENFTVAEAETFSITDTESNDVQLMSIAPRGIDYNKKTKTLTATKDVKLSSVCAGSITVEVSDLKLYHKENTGRGDYEAYITAKTVVTKTISFDFGSYVGLPNSIVLGYIPLEGIGDIRLEVDISLKGGMSETQEGNIMAGFGYTRNDGFRLIKGYKQTSYSFTAEAEVKIGLTYSVNIDLVVVSGRIWATVGVKGTYHFKDYTYVDQNRPLQCETIKAYLYANVGVSASINYFVDQKSWSKVQDIYTEDNSPARVYYHYEDGELVEACTRSKTNNEAYTKYTTKTTSKYFNPAPSYSKSSYTDSSTGTTTTLWTYTLDSSKNATITGYKGSATAIAIPSKIDGYNVTVIGSRAFSNTTIKSVTMSDSIIEIKTYAFANCTSLNNVRLSKKLERLGYSAFAGCKNLTTIEIPKSLTGGDTIGNPDYAIFKNAGIKYVTFEEGITQIPPKILESCSNLETITLPDTITKICNDAFSNCTALREIEIPDSVTEIGARAFEDCFALKSITIPASVQMISSSAFNNCTYLTDVYMEDGVIEIKTYAFANCTSLNNVRLSKKLERLGYSAFAGCKNLTTIEIPKSLTGGDTIGNPDYAIFKNAGIKYVTFEEGITQIPPKILESCSNLETITLPDTITKICNDAFSNCTALREIEIPDSVTEIGYRAFEDCISLKKAIISNNCTDIYSNTFYNCSSLIEIKLPENLETIGGSAFYGCKSLTTIDLPETLKTIEGSVFYECNALSEITIPENVTSIGSSAFQNCDALTKAEIKGSGAIGEKAFYDCDALTSITIGDKVTSIGKNMCYGCDKLTDIKLGKGITTIPDSAFRLCQSLETVTIPRFCTTIAANAFSENTKLTSAYVPESVTSMNTTNSFSYPAKMTMYGKSGSYAEEYANSRSMAFVAVDAPITTLAYPESSMNIGYRATVTPDMQIMPEFDTDTITFTSGDTNIATVSASGAVYGKSYGTTTITMTTESGLSDSIEVTVVRPATSVTLNKEGFELASGNSEVLTATVSPTNSTDVIKWSSDNTSVAVVDDSGKITAISKGTANITATAIYGNKSDTCLVTVVESNVPIVNVTGITLNSNEQEITIGKTYTLKANVLPQDATNKLVEWTTSNSSIADIADGVVTAKSLGEATITAKTVSGGFVATCKVTVIPKVEITKFAVTPMGGYGLIDFSAVNVPNDAKVYLAAIDLNEIVVSTSVLTLSNGSAQTILPLAGLDKLKIYIWKNNLKPLCLPEILKIK